MADRQEFPSDLKAIQIMGHPHVFHDVQEFFCDVAQPTAVLRILGHLDQPGHHPLLHRRPERVQLRRRRQLQREHHKHRLPNLCLC